MSKLWCSFGPFALAVALLSGSLSPLAGQVAVNADAHFAPRYRVTFHNLTRGQVLSPPIAVTHRERLALFEIGAPVIDELALIAEDGDTSALASLLTGLDSVRDVSTAGAPIPPGGSLAIEIDGSSAYRISVAGMLVNSNDAFFALDTVLLPSHRFRTRSYYALAYDAGSEENNEDCGFIPGPACAGAGAGVRATAGAEGFVHVHAGIQGVGDLGPDNDWRNPTVKVEVQRIR